MWVGYIEFDDETGEVIGADYSGLEVPTTYGLQFNSNYKYRGEWNCDMKFITNTSEMFNGCTNLTSFNGDLSSLTNGVSMFNGCSNLTSFNGDLSSLTDGYSMFSSCKLDKDSVIRIITCLRESNTCSSSEQLTIGVDKQYQNDPELLEVLGITSWTSSVTLVGHGGGTWAITLEAN